MALDTSDSGQNQDRVSFFNIKGRNGFDDPLLIPQDQCQEALDVDWFQSSLGGRRGGAVALSLSGGTAQTGIISFLGSFVNSDNEGDREMWAIDDAATPRWKRLFQSTSWADVTVTDSVSSKPWETVGVEYNGKIHFFYDSAVNRSHCWDPADATVRRTGIAPASAAPTTALAGGAVTDSRKYGAVFERWDASNNVRVRSEMSPVTGVVTTAAQQVTVTRPTAPGEQETHWALYAANISDNYSTYYRMGTAVVATTTIVDNSASFQGLEIADPIGQNTCLPSAKVAVADRRRLIMAGAWETSAGSAITPSIRRIWWTPPLGDTDIGDDERVENTADIKGYSDIDRPVIGFSNPADGITYAFSYTGLWKMVATDSVTAPYTINKVTGGRGCIRHHTIVDALDESGNSIIAWLNRIGPYRLGSNGQQYLGNDVKDLWAITNLSATNAVAHGVYHADIHQIWWWVASGSSNDPDMKIVYDTRLGKLVEFGMVIRGWARHSGKSAAARCSCMHSNTVASSMSRDLKPYVGHTTGTKILKCDVRTAVDDDGTTYQSYLTSRPFMPWGAGKLGGIPLPPMVIGQTHATAALKCIVYGDFKAQLKINSGTISLAPVTTGALETRVFPIVQGVEMSDINSFFVFIGDLNPVAVTPWLLDAVIIPTTMENSR